MKFLVDAQLLPAVAQWLRGAGHDAQTVREIGLREAEDDDIWNHALATGAVIVWLRIGNCTNTALRQWFMPRLPQILDWIEQGVRKPDTKMDTNRVTSGGSWVWPYWLELVGKSIDSTTVERVLGPIPTAGSNFVSTPLLPVPTPEVLAWRLGAGRWSPTGRWC